MLFLQRVTYTNKRLTKSCDKQAFSLSVQITEQNYTLISIPGLQASGLSPSLSFPVQGLSFVANAEVWG